jgi:hypothetical protein
LIASLRYRFLGMQMKAPISQAPSLPHRLARVAGQALVLALLALPALFGGKAPPLPLSRSGPAPSAQLQQVAGLVLSEGPLPARLPTRETP